MERFTKAFGGLERSARDSQVDKFINTDPTQISWSSSLLLDLVRLKKGRYQESKIVISFYRPFTKQWLYCDAMFNHRPYQMPKIFPDATSENRVICVSGIGARSGFSVNMTDKVPDVQFMDNGQCYPLYLFDEPQSESGDKKSQNTELFALPEKDAERIRRDALTDEGLVHFQLAYPGEQISKEDVFYYIYGLLYSPDYRERYADNLSKELPRIPRVKTATNFWAFSKAGRKLSDLHLNYEAVEPYPLKIESGGKLTLIGIPLEAYDYIVNGKPAIDWVVERQCVKTDKDSGIVNDANDWAVETMGNPKYPLELFQRVITVSLETMKIVNGLPELDI